MWPWSDPRSIAGSEEKGSPHLHAPPTLQTTGLHQQHESSSVLLSYNLLPELLVVVVNLGSVTTLQEGDAETESTRKLGKDGEGNRTNMLILKGNALHTTGITPWSRNTATLPCGMWRNKSEWSFKVQWWRVVPYLAAICLRACSDIPAIWQAATSFTF